MIFDSLTSAYTMSGFYTAAQNFFLKNEYQGIILIDLDGLKRVNHINGTETGDALLKIVVHDIYKTIPHALVGRVGDDEFAVFLPMLESETALERYAAEIVEKSRAVREVLDAMVMCTVTAGVIYISRAEYGERAFAELMNLAGFALSGAKRAGGNRYTVYSEEMMERYTRTDLIKKELQNMISTDSALYKYQPITDLKTGAVGGFEMLARMSGGKFADVSPAEFIHIARENNMIRYFDISALKTACNALNALSDRGINGVYISVNVSPEFFMSPDFYGEITKIAVGSGINLNTLVIELTEETFIASYERAKEVIDRLSDMGIRFYVDDFGTGYSNLSRLQELNMSVLKIDKSLVDKVEKNDSLIKKTIEIARIFNMKVVAEGIETENQLKLLAALGCDMGQGYYIGKPMSFDDMEKFIKENGKGK